jgi:aryl carrier-like protein
MWAPGTYRPQDIKAMEAIENVTKRAVLEATKWTGLEANDNFFERGMDSLQVLKLIRNLRVETSILTIQPSTIYLRPTVTALAEDLKKLISEDYNSESNQKGEQLSIMSGTLKKYMDKIDQIDFDTGTAITAYEMNKQVVLLTGSIGSIASYILKTLLQEDRIFHIYCLNRSADSSTLQQERNKFLDSSLPTDFSKDKVTFLSADLSDSTSLGLPKDVYTTITERIMLVVHNAPFQTSDSQLSGIVNLCSLCRRSALKARFVFISSISLRYEP